MQREEPKAPPSDGDLVSTRCKASLDAVTWSAGSMPSLPAWCAGHAGPRIAEGARFPVTAAAALLDAAEAVHEPARQCDGRLLRGSRRVYRPRLSASPATPKGAAGGADAVLRADADRRELRHGGTVGIHRRRGRVGLRGAGAARRRRAAGSAGGDRRCVDERLRSGSRRGSGVNQRRSSRSREDRARERRFDQCRRAACAGGRAGRDPRWAVRRGCSRVTLSRSRRWPRSRHEAGLSRSRRSGLLGVGEVPERRHDRALRRPRGGARRAAAGMGARGRGRPVRAGHDRAGEAGVGKSRLPGRARRRSASEGRARTLPLLRQKGSPTSLRGGGDQAARRASGRPGSGYGDSSRCSGRAMRPPSAEEIAWAFRKLSSLAPLLVVFDDIQWGE